MSKHTMLNFVKVLGLILVINLIGSKYFFRADMTVDKRYTLSKTSQIISAKLTEPIYIEVYLKGDYPLDFQRLGQATLEHLEERKAFNKKIKYQMVSPTGMEEKLIDKGMEPSSLTVEEQGSIEQMLIFPYALVKVGEREEIVSLLVPSANSQEDQLSRSIENLEYAFSECFAQLTSDKKKTLAVLRSNESLEDIFLFDALNSLKTKYNLAPFDLEPKHTLPDLVLKDLTQYDALLIPKPLIAFSENEKLILDQYVMQGGKTIWLIDQVVAEMDSLQAQGEAMFIPRDLNTTDLLFSYGVRINYDLVQDLYSSKIAIATGNIGEQTQFQNFLWPYFPLVQPYEHHPITRNVAPVNLKFPSSIDTLPNNLSKTILLQSSNLTKVTGVPQIVSLDVLAEEVDPEKFQAPHQILGVLLEGNFPSAFAHRTLPFAWDIKKESSANKMLVISDGDIIANQIQNGQPTSLEMDKWTGQYYGNKNFLLNAVEYLMDDTGLIQLRGKKLEIKMLNIKKVAQEKVFWQMINILLPIFMLLLSGIGYILWRRRKYATPYKERE